MSAYSSKLGYFLLADISGFTAYLVDVELEHASDILEELLEYIAEQIRPVFIVHDFDPDSVFAYYYSARFQKTLKHVTLKERFQRLKGLRADCEMLRRWETLLSMTG